MVMVWSLLLILATAVCAWSQEQTIGRGPKLYQEQCSTCHGMMTAETRQHRFTPPVWKRVAVNTSWSIVPTFTMSTAPMNRHGIAAPGPHGQIITPSARPGEHVTVAPPYGPSLRGVYGRPAGSVKDFRYSRAFMEVLQGMVWNRRTLDVWLTDSQAWVRGSRMFYRQPEAEVRQQIIAYLEASK